MEIASNLPWLHPGPVRFIQILFNLLSNAMKFTPKGGTITVRARRLTGGANRTGFEPRGDHQEVLTLESILVLDGEEGNRELVKAVFANGGLEVEHASDGAQALAVATGNPPDLILLDLLLVDDEALTRPFYGDLLSQHGSHVHKASSGQVGLELARQYPLETVILDIVMGGVCGLEVLERLHEEDPNLPVIMLSGRPTAQNAIAALKLGAFDFLVKGLDHNLVVLAVPWAVRFRRETLQQKAELQRLYGRIAALGKAAGQA